MAEVLKPFNRLGVTRESENRQTTQSIDSESRYLSELRPPGKQIQE